MTTQPVAKASGTFSIGGDLTVNRLGFGAMRLPGPGVWGPPADRDEAIRVLRRAVDLGVNFIDTADSYGPYVSEELIREALHPYPDDLVVATKAGLLRTGPGTGWIPLGKPAYLRQEAEMSLRRLAVECIDLFQLHRIDADYPLEDQVGELAALQSEGKIRHIGLSQVSVEELQAAQQVASIASVQNMYNLTERRSEPLLEAVEAQPRSGSFRGSRWPPARWPPLTGRCNASPPSTTPPRRNSRWRGCCGAHRSCCRSPARPRWRTSRRTSPPRKSS